jgi:NAD(P)-dependent dehydrogenase (short-subunit alcohol dehydrogenase family)
VTMAELNGKVALVTGAAGALGRAVVAALDRAGATLALTDRDAGKLRAAHGDAYWQRACELARGEDVQRLVDAVAADHGRLDLLVNCHGAYRGGASLHETALSEWDALIDANARSVYHTCRAAVPHLLRAAEQRGGGSRIVNVAARAALSGSAGSAIYTASKAAVVRLTESLAAELRERGVGVNCVLPGTIDTAANRASRPGADASRWVSPEAIADVILFLCGEGARGIHGAAIPVYGLS